MEYIAPVTFEPHDPLNLRHRHPHSNFSSSTSKMRVALGGMTPGWPVAPYAMSGVQVILARWPRLICRVWREEGEGVMKVRPLCCVTPVCVSVLLQVSCLTCATPSSQPLITSCRPILNLKGLFLSREESNFFPFWSIPDTERPQSLIHLNRQRYKRPPIVLSKHHKQEMLTYTPLLHTS